MYVLLWQPVNPRMHNQGPTDPAHRTFLNIFSQKKFHCPKFPDIFNKLRLQFIVVFLFHNLALDLRKREFCITILRMHDQGQIDPNAFQVVKQL